MGYIGHKLCLHPLVFHFFIHCLLKSFLDFLQLLLDRIEHPDIPLDRCIQMSFRQLICGLQQQLIFLLEIFHIFSQEQEQDHRVDDQRECSVIPEETYDRQDDIVNDHDLQDRPVRLFTEVYMLQRIILLCEKSFCPFYDTTCLSHHFLVALGPLTAIMADQLHCQRPVTPVRAFHAYHRSQRSHSPEEKAEDEKPHRKIDDRRNDLHAVAHARNQCTPDRHIHNPCRELIQRGGIHKNPHKYRHFKWYVKHLHLTDIQLSPEWQKQRSGSDRIAERPECILIICCFSHTLIWLNIIFPVFR